jgi:hypothetical protein
MKHVNLEAYSKRADKERNYETPLTAESLAFRADGRSA